MIRCRIKKTQRHRPAHYQDPSPWLKDQHLMKTHSTSHSLYIYWRSFLEVLQSSKSWICDRLIVHCRKACFKLNCCQRRKSCMVVKRWQHEKPSQMAINCYMKSSINLKLCAKGPEGTFTFKACGYFCHRHCWNPLLGVLLTLGQALRNPWGNPWGNRLPQGMERDRSWTVVVLQLVITTSIVIAVIYYIGTIDWCICVT